MTQLEYVLNTVPNWEDLLVAAPYNLTVTHYGPYVMLQHRDDSDMGAIVVQEACGIIFKKTICGYQCVCQPFRKFFEYGTKRAAIIDWSTAVASEKVNGTTVHVWYDNGWHLSTTEWIDAENEAAQSAAITGQPVNQFFKYWDENMTHIFQMTADRIYIIGWIDTKSGRELPIYNGWRRYAHDYMGLWSPEQHGVSSLTDRVTAANLLSGKEAVICDQYFNRVTVKSLDEAITRYYG